MSRAAITLKGAELLPWLMLELQARGAAEPEKTPEERKPLIRRIMEDARGWIDCMIMVVNGTRITLTANDELNANNVADAAHVIADATIAVIELLGARKFKELDLRIQGGRHLIIRRYKGCYIAALTKPNPNIGLIRLALDKNLASEKPAGRMTRIAEEMIMRARVK